MKLYPFSCQRHAHDIEFMHNSLKNMLADIDSGEMNTTANEYSILLDRIDGVRMLLNDIYQYAPKTAWLTGPQIDLAKKIMIWASEERVKRG